MNETSETTASRLRGARRATLVFTVLAAFATSCSDLDVFLPNNVPGGPAGALDGTVTYAGPLPCTEKQHVVGAAVLLVIDTRFLPPPEGFGTTATSLGVVPGEVLFAGVRDRLTFNADGSRWCPAADAPPATVSAAFAIAPLDGGVYQVRGFYDRDGNFDPGFTIQNLPTRGDIGGGAIENAAAVLAGAAPIYRAIPLGVPAANGARTLPPEGARISGIAVNLGLPIPLDRPLFYPQEVRDTTSTNNTDPLDVKMPSDFQLSTFSALDPVATEASFIRLGLGAGVAPGEIDIAAAAPFGFPVNSAAPSSIVYSRHDVNGDGTIDALDHVPDSDRNPSLFPLSIFAKLPDGDEPASLATPLVVMQGLTLYQSLPATATAPPTLAALEAEAFVAVRPAALCLDPSDTSKPGVLVITHPTDKAMNKIIANEQALADALSQQFHREMTIAYGCLPQGRYSINLVYPTGQTWSLPNEAGVCAASEPATNDGKSCVAGTSIVAPRRARLASQAAALTIIAPTDTAYCATNPTPPACLPPPR